VIAVNVSLGRPAPGTTWADTARHAEALGFRRLQLPDHLGPTMAGPFAALGTAAGATTTLGLATYVLNNDLRHPAITAAEAATLADASGGRFTLGLGAGHMEPEYEAAGLTYDAAPRRVERLGEALAILRPLLAGEAVTRDGQHYQVQDLRVREPGGPRVPLLVGGNGTEVLRLAGAMADEVSLTGFGPTDGGRGVRLTHFSEVGLAERLTVVRDAAGDRWPLPIDLLVQVVDVEHRPDVVLDRLSARFGLPVEVLRTSPFVLVGSPEQATERLHELHERFGVTSVTVFANRTDLPQPLDAMAPVLARLGPSGP
jgi:probable F420-dependent oxidoreductase